MLAEAVVFNGLKHSEAATIKPPKVALTLSEEEADVLLNILLSVAPSEQIPAETAERLLCRVAEMQRAFQCNDND